MTKKVFVFDVLVVTVVMEGEREGEIERRLVRATESRVDFWFWCLRVLLPVCMAQGERLWVTVWRNFNV